MEPAPEADTLNQQQSRFRHCLLTLGAVIAVLLPLFLIEIGLRCFTSPPPQDDVDPYVSFAGIQPLFILDSSGTRYETADNRLAYFRPQSFSATKPSGQFRIFCLGGSTVQGRPYSVETSFSTWLELGLNAVETNTEYKTINCGGISYASYRLIPILKEIFNYEPDLVILYTGHNEFLEDRTYEGIRKAPSTLIRLHVALLNLRSYALAHNYLAPKLSESAKRNTASPSVLPEEVHAKLDLSDGLKSYHRDDYWRENVIAHFQNNLEIMTRMCRERRVPLIILNPVSNLKDCPPFKSEVIEGLSDERREQFAEQMEKADTIKWYDTLTKLHLLTQAADIDSRHAGLQYQIGKCYEILGRSPEAKQRFLRAKEEDICPLRILQPMNDIIKTLADRHHLQMVDVLAMIEERTPDGIPGDEWLLDHVHPTITGHQLIANSLIQTIGNMGLVQPTTGWEEKRDALWQQHLSTLSDTYYVHGSEQLTRLEEWSRGRIPNPPPVDNSQAK